MADFISARTCGDGTMTVRVRVHVTLPFFPRTHLQLPAPSILQMPEPCAAMNRNTKQ